MVYLTMCVAVCVHTIVMFGYVCTHLDDEFDLVRRRQLEEREDACVCARVCACVCVLQIKKFQGGSEQTLRTKITLSNATTAAVRKGNDMCVCVCVRVCERASASVAHAAIMSSCSCATCVCYIHVCV